ncbi:hypothetical protein [Streptomyces sp.]
MATTSTVRGSDPRGRQHIVRVTSRGSARRLECDTCGWVRSAQFLPWLKARDHLAEAHGAEAAPE